MGLDLRKGRQIGVDASGRVAVGIVPAVMGRAAIKSATDAHSTRILAELSAWITWLNGARGAVTEFGWPCRGKDAVEWSGLGEAWLRALDAAPSQVWAQFWGTEFGDVDAPFDASYAGTFSANQYNRFGVYSHVPYAGEPTLLGPVGRMTLAASVLEAHYSKFTTNRYGVVINAGCNGYVGTTMGTEAQTPGRSMPYNPGPTHDLTQGIGGGLTTGTSEYNYGTLVAPAGTMTTPEFLGARGVGVVRIPIRWERIQPVLGQALSVTELARLDEAVAAYHAEGISVILDIHNWGYYFVDDNQGTNAHVLGDSTVTQAMFVDLWTRMATHYVGMAGVIGYELMNEPAGVASAAAWQTISQAAFDAIKAVDTATQILVGTGGGGDYSQMSKAATSHPSGPWITGDTHNQARYVSHHYWDVVGSRAQYTASYQQNITDAIGKGYTQSEMTDGAFASPTVRTAASLTMLRRSGNNRWHNPPGVYSGTIILAAGTLYMIPILAERPISISAFCAAWTAHATGGHIRVGVYADAAAIPSGNPLCDTGAIAVAGSNGNQKFALGSALALARGKYWIGFLVENDLTGTTPTVGAYTPINDGVSIVDGANGAAMNNCAYYSGLTTTLPTLSTQPTTIASLTWPSISYQVSAFT